MKYPVKLFKGGQLNVNKEELINCLKCYVVYL